ncbi:unnamed protein product [Psylliodes chrysocephalus]|uniref:Mutator-like transposase domain-containing protein n=1 Tax=Psylliodes chrysocephalus TaxID=3402493 RepID=A0A9P0G4W7_9CUCU|nr:unnamed protein product [Psylliodes chrysocephala]
MNNAKKLRKETPSLRNNLCNGRIVGLRELGKHLKCCLCERVLSLENITNETRKGLYSILNVKCNQCNIETIVPTDKVHATKSEVKHSDVNTKAVLDRLAIIRNFNELKSHNEQSLYLAGLISHEPVKRRRQREANDEDVIYHSFFYKYKVRVMRENGTQEIPICYKAMLSLHGISAKRLQNIQQKLVKDGHAGEDCRGRHTNRPNKLDKKQPMQSVVIFGHLKASNSSALDMNQQLHLKKTESFNQRKRPERKRAQQYGHIEAIAMDYQKNLQLPNISTNDVYYKKQ